MLFLNILLIWLVMGLLTFVWGYVAAKNPENADKVEECLHEISRECHVSKEESKAIAYTLFIVLGFILLPFIMTRKLLRFVKKEK